MAMEDEQKLKDMLRAIEAQETIEDIPDSEDYDDMGGIKSLDRGAPSIKMASEPEDEFELELGTVIKEYNDLKEKGDPAVRDIELEDYINLYLSRKKMMENERAMASYGGRMKYADGMKPDSMSNPAVVTKIDNMREFQRMNPDVEDVADYKSKYLKLKAQDEEIKRMLDKAKKEKVKRAKGGIAGVL